MISKKDINKLEGLLYLYALSKIGSKREVAGKLGTSVDTINKYINDLEAETKSVFLASNGRGTSITPEGERVLQISETIVKAIRSISDYAESSDKYRGIVRVGMTDAIADYLGTDELSAFMEKYPELQIENDLNNVLPDMSTMEADICVGYDAPNHPDLVLVGVKKVVCGLFASKDYISKYGRPKDMDDLVKNHRICDKDNHTLCVPGWKEIISNAQHLVYKTSSVFALHSALIAGMGVGICPLNFCSENMIYLDGLDFEFAINIYLIAHKETKDTPRIRLVLDLIKELIQSPRGCKPRTSF